MDLALPQVSPSSLPGSAIGAMDRRGGSLPSLCLPAPPSPSPDLRGSWVPVDRDAHHRQDEQDDDKGSPVDQFDRLPDSLLLLVFNSIADVKVLGRCAAVSRRFRALAPLVDNVLVRVDCVISDDDHPPPTPTSSSSCPPAAAKPRGGLFCHLARLVLGGIVRPLQAIGQILAASPAAAAARSSSSSSSFSSSSSPEVSHHSPTEVLRNFREIRRLRIELPAGELGVDDGVLLKWKAGFGSTLDSCVILGANSVLPSSEAALAAADATEEKGATAAEANGIRGGGDDNGSIPESFYTNESLKLRVVWTISSLIAASARHFLLQPIIADHDTLESLELTDADGQGVLRMERGQLEELRVKPVSVSGSSQRTLVPALDMRLWYAPHLELPGGAVLKGATLLAIRPTDHSSSSSSSRELPPAGDAFAFGFPGGAHLDTSWVATAFEEPYASAVRQLAKRTTFCLEMNSF